MRNLKPWTRASFMALACITLAAQTSRGVALVAERSGKVMWEGGEVLVLFDDVPPHKTVVLGKGARLTVLTLKSGDELVFQGPSRFRFTAQGLPEGSEPIERRKVPAGLRGALGFKPGTLAQAGMVMREVHGERNWAETPPSMILGSGHTFRWRGAGAGVSYRLRVWDTLGELLLQRETAETSLVLPEGTTLAENEIYRWTVDTLMNGSALGSQSGRFRFLPKAQREQLVQARPGPGASFAHRLLFASMLDHFQVHEEARVQWLTLAKERPEDPVLQELASVPKGTH